MSSDRLLQDGRFELLCRIGHGGMGSVWAAEDRLLERAVALKQLVPGNAGRDRDTARERAIHEARALAKIRHPVIVPVYDLFHSEGDPWIVMEYIEGHSLQTQIEGTGPLDDMAAAWTGQQVAQGLDAAHTANVVHRDVKPDNILISTRAGRQAIILVDFGIARIADAKPLTQLNNIVGTLPYLAPERFRQGGQVGPPADQWSLGVTLYIAVEGVHPFPSGYATGHAIVHEPPRPMTSGSRLGGLISLLLQKEPDHRPDARWVARELGKLLRELKPKSRSQNDPSAGTGPTRVAGPNTVAGWTHTVNGASRGRSPWSPGRPQQGHDVPAQPSGRVHAGDVRERVPTAGPDAAIRMLLSISEADAAAILTDLPEPEATPLLQEIANVRPITAGVIMQMFDLPRAVTSAAHLLPATTAALLTDMLPRDAAQIMGGMDEQIAGLLVKYLQPDVAVPIFWAMESWRAAAILTEAKTTAAADVLRADPLLANEVLDQLSGPDRHQLRQLIAQPSGRPPR